jgi:hypothetical protein
MKRFLRLRLKLESREEQLKTLIDAVLGCLPIEHLALRTYQPSSLPPLATAPRWLKDARWADGPWSYPGRSA